MLIFSCKQTDKSTSKTHLTSFIDNETLEGKVDTDTSKISNASDIKTDSFQNLMDSLVKNYIAFSNTDLIKLSRKEKIPEDWILDQTLKTDTATYYIFHIGHETSDSDGKEVRFVTDAWIYIDSLTNNIYEYNLSRDSLTKWEK
jgi:hypothetical protein